jgi:thymidylate kinase
MKNVQFLHVFLAFLRFILYLCIWKDKRFLLVKQRQKPQDLCLLAAAARHSHVRHKILPRPPQQFAAAVAN